MFLPIQIPTLALLSLTAFVTFFSLLIIKNCCCFVVLSEGISMERWVESHCCRLGLQMGKWGKLSQSAYLPWSYILLLLILDTKEFLFVINVQLYGTDISNMASVLENTKESINSRWNLHTTCRHSLNFP